MMPESRPAVIKMGLRARVSIIPFMNMSLLVDGQLQFVGHPIMVIMTCHAETYACTIHIYMDMHMHVQIHIHIDIHMHVQIHRHGHDMSWLYITLCVQVCV